MTRCSGLQQFKKDADGTWPPAFSRSDGATSRYQIEGGGGALYFPTSGEGAESISRTTPCAAICAKIHANLRDEFRTPSRQAESCSARGNRHGRLSSSETEAGDLHIPRHRGRNYWRVLDDLKAQGGRTLQLRQVSERAADSRFVTRLERPCRDRDTAGRVRALAKARATIRRSLRRRAALRSDGLRSYGA